MESINNKRAAIIGGANMDICGKPAGELILRDSTPGAVSVQPGGVGRNIAHDLRLMGMNVSLITALGGDVYGKALAASCEELGIDLSLSLSFPDRRSSTYLYICDGQGNMLAAVNDMDITDCITPEALAPRMQMLNSFDAVVIDANLSERTIAYIAENCTAPLYADAVSCAKAKRLLPVLPRLTAIKVNLMEAKTLSGEQDAENCAKWLIDRGIKEVFITLGGEGIFAADKSGCVCFPAGRVTVVNTNGAGDAVTAAIVAAKTAGASLRGAAYTAIRAGKIAVSAESTNPAELAGLWNE